MQRVFIPIVVSVAYLFTAYSRAEDSGGEIEASLLPAVEVAIAQPNDLTNDIAVKPQVAVSLEAIAAQQVLVTESTEVDEETKAKATVKLNEAKQSLIKAKEAAEETNRFRSEIERAPERKKELAQELEGIETPTFDRSDRTIALKDLERIVSTRQNALDQAKDSHAEYLEVLAKSSERKSTASQREEGFSKRLDKTRTALDAMANANDDLSVVAERTALQALVVRLEAEAIRDKLEIERFDALADHQTLRNDLHQRTVASLESQISQLNSIIVARRNEETRRQFNEAKKEARNANAALRNIAEENAKLAEVRTEYAKKIGSREKRFEKITRDLAEREETFNKVVARINDFGMTQATGELLRLQRENLSDVGPLQERNRKIERELPVVRQKLAEYKELREPMYDIEGLVDENLPAEGSEIWEKVKPAEIRQMVRELLESRKAILDSLNDDLEDYSNDLQELYFSTKKYIEIAKKHAKYIDEHVLWIRSSDAISQVDIDRTRTAFHAVATTGAWNRLLGGIGTIIRENQTQSCAIFLLMVLGMSFCDRIADRVSAIGQRQEVLRAYRFVPTIEAILLTIVLASFWPVVFVFFGWQLANQHDATPLSLGVGHGLWWTAITWWALNLLRQISRPDGLGESHFGWHRKNLEVIRSNVRWLMTFGLPFVFLVMGLRNFNLGKSAESTESTGRVAFIAGMIVMSLFTHFMLNPYGRKQGIWAKQQIWVYKIRHVLHAVGISIPISLALLCAVGYIYSAFQLTHRAHLTLWMVLSVVLVHALVTRYLLITRKRVAVKHMRQRQAQAAEATSEQSDGPRAEESLDFNVIGEQLQRLLRAVAAISLCIGISFVWADMVPALTAVNRVKFKGWEKEIVVEEFDQASEKMVNVAQSVPVTLGDVMISMLLIGGTLVATRNLPGLLNITIFERLPIDFGTRYALTTVVRYVTTMVGFVAAFRTVGFTWNSVQWLVAAMTVGLGFGLQEIFANFVSGLIILTERPIRVGDMVTVSGVMGKVTKMQIRATTITDFDRRELVVPNKKFITEDVINWTLSDSITRVVCRVGIAYHCDPGLARNVLTDVARKHSEVLNDPAPSAVFLGFGDSTLNLELRVFIVGREQIAQVQDELNLAINSAFRNANLEIAFPQRDLHIRSIDAAVQKTLNEQKRAA